MTVSTTNSRDEYIANAGQTIFPYTFRVFASTDIQVYANGALVDPSLYLVTRYGSGTGGNITFLSGRTAGDTILILRVLPLTQATSWPSGDKFPSVAHEAAADRLVLLVQQVLEILERAPKTLTASTFRDLTVPDPQAGYALRWNPGLTGLENYQPEAVDPGALLLPIDIEYGGTGATTAADARTSLAAAAAAHTHPASDVVSGTVGTARLGSGTADATVFLRGDQAWASPPAAAATPTGAIVAYGAASPPSGWLLCSGASISTSTYADLFAVIGYTYGGSGANFNLPDLRGRFPLGKDDMGGSAANRVAGATALGASGGNQYLQNHAHVSTGLSVAVATGTSPTAYNAEGAVLIGDHGHSVSGNTGNPTSATVNEMPPWQLINYMIKT